MKFGGSFLIDIKCRVQAIIAPVIFQLYDFNFTEEKMLTEPIGTLINVKSKKESETKRL